MKQFILALMLLATTALNSAAQTVYKTDQSGTLVQQQTIHTEEQAIGSAQLNGETFKDLQGNTYPVYVTAKGRKVIIKKAKSGNHYKVYLDQADL